MGGNQEILLIIKTFVDELCSISVWSMQTCESHDAMDTYYMVVILTSFFLYLLKKTSRPDILSWISLPVNYKTTFKPVLWNEYAQWSAPLNPS